MGRDKNRKGQSGRDPGGFLALPWSVVDSRAYTHLSAHARALLIEVGRQYVRDNNGRLLLSRAYMAKRGWKSSDTLSKAKRELLEGGFIHETVKGHRPNKASWYAITWQVLDRHPDYDPGAVETFERSAYRRNAPMKNANLGPRNGTEVTAIAPPHGTGKRLPVPRHGPIKGVLAPLSVPPHGHHLDKPSAVLKGEVPNAQAGRYVRLRARPSGLFTCLLTASRPPKNERLSVAREALQRALDRPRRGRPAPMSGRSVVVGDDCWTRERDPDAQDLSAWE